MNNSRTKNVLINMWVGTFFQILSLIMGFISRTIFIKILSAEYLGINSLFTNILTILSFAELGIGNAIVFHLYKPLADNNETKLKKLLNFYKKIYFIIGLIILLCGLALIPFIPSLINEVPNIQENINFIYVIFLLDTVISYFFTYRTSIITADQKNYIVIRTVYIFKIFQIIIQMIVLSITHNYYLYLILQLTNTFITFLYLSYKSKKMYPFTKKLGKEIISKKERKQIFTNVKALFINKFASVILNGTDSIIISKYLGLTILGLYSNYYLLVNAVTQILGQLFNAFTSSIGNLIAKDESKKSKEVFYQLFYFTQFVYCVVCICMYLLFNDFVTLWIGKDYLLSNFVVLMIISHLYFNGIQFSGFTYRNVSGNFNYFRYMPIVSAVINIVLSIVFAKWIGLGGVFLATIISRVSTSTWIDPYIIYKRVFKCSNIEYYKKYFTYLIIVGICFIPCYFVSKLIIVKGILTLILKGIILLSICSITFIILTFRSKEYKEIKCRVFGFFKLKV